MKAQTDIITPGVLLVIGIAVAVTILMYVIVDQQAQSIFYACCEKNYTGNLTGDGFVNCAALATEHKVSNCSIYLSKAS